MDLREYLRLLRRRWKIVAATAVVLIAGSLTLTVTTPKTYQATTEVFVSLRDSNSGSTGAYQGNLFSQDRVKSYAQIVGSPAVTKPVIDKLRLPVTPAELGDRVSAQVPTGTVLVDIIVSDRDPSLARDIANSVAGQFGLVVRNLERSSATSSPVTVTVVRPADRPADPVSPRPVLNIGLGLVVGLALGVGLAIVRETLDTSVKTTDDLRPLTDAPSLGEIAFDARAAEHPLVIDEGPSGARAEAFRTVRTNLRFVDVDRPPQVVVVTGPLQAEGKSTTACNLSLTLATAGVDVILVEGDLRRPRVAEYLGLEGAVGLTDVLVGRHNLRGVLQSWGDVSLRVLPCGEIPPNPSELLGSTQMHLLLDELRGMADIVIIDAPPLLPVTDAAVLAQGSDGAILVVRYGRTTREHVSRAVAALRAVNARTLGTILTMVPQRGPHSHGYGRSYYLSDAATPPLTAVVGGNVRLVEQPTARRRSRRRAG
jgi:capsular exopolysaccharide synthesis family protein